MDKNPENGLKKALKLGSNFGNFNKNSLDKCAKHGYFQIFIWCIDYISTYQIAIMEHCHSLVINYSNVFASFEDGGFISVHVLYKVTKAKTSHWLWKTSYRKSILYGSAMGIWHCFIMILLLYNMYVYKLINYGEILILLRVKANF